MKYIEQLEYSFEKTDFANELSQSCHIVLTCVIRFHSSLDRSLIKQTTFPIQLGCFGIVAWMDTVSSLEWQTDATDTIPTCKSGKYLFLSAMKLLVLTRENLKNVGE